MPNVIMKIFMLPGLISYPSGNFVSEDPGPHVRNKVGFSSTTNGHKKKEDLLNDVFERIGKDFEGCEHDS